MAILSLFISIGCRSTPRHGLQSEPSIQGPQNSLEIDAVEEAEAWEAQALKALESGDIGRALSHYNQAIAIARTFEGDPRLSRLLNDRGVAEAKMGLRAKAMESFGEAYALRSQEVGGEGVGPILYNQGMVHWQLGRSDEALRALEEALDLSPLEQKPEIYLNLSEIYLEEGEGELALARARGGAEAIRGLQEGGAEVALGQEAWAMTQEGLSLGLLGEYEAAMEGLDAAIPLWLEAGDDVQAGQAAYNLALIALDVGDEARAQRYFEVTLEHALRVGDDVSIPIIESYLEELDPAGATSLP